MKKITIKVTPFGIFAFHKGKLIKKEIWQQEKYAENYFNRENLIKQFNSNLRIKAKREIVELGYQEAEKLAKQLGIDFDFQKFMIDFTKIKLKFGFSKDKLLVHAINMFDDVSKVINLFYERLREWYGLYWPEKVKEVKSIEEFVKVLGEKRSGKSMGFDLDEEDLKILKISCDELKTLISYKEKLNNYIESIVNEIAPNTSKIAGPILTARLIFLAGGLKKLAEMPSSTIQILGAEKALFRHLRKGTKPPKHGVILSHNLMLKVKQSKRGKLARLLASKISLAAKVDYYSGGKQVVWKKLMEDLNKKLSSF